MTPGLSDKYTNYSVTAPRRFRSFNTWFYITLNRRILCKYNNKYNVLQNNKTLTINVAALVNQEYPGYIRYKQ